MEIRMSKVEYKTILMPYRPSIFQDDATEVSTMLNKEGLEGWRLSQLVMPSSLWGRANGMLAVLERAKP